MSLEQINERRAKWFWVTIIVGLLGSQLGIGVIAIVIANSDPSSKALPNYHQRALDWDKSVALQEKSRQLGWRLDLHVAPTVDPQLHRAVMLTLTDAKGQPIEKATGNVKFFHHSLASDIQEYPLDELARGVYRVDSRLSRPGLWQMELRVVGPHGEAFLHEQTLDLPTVSNKPEEVPS
jgi:nitrogen fixation protein FixH